MKIDFLRTRLGLISPLQGEELVRVRVDLFRQLASDYIELAEAADALIAGLQRTISDGNIWRCDSVGEEGCEIIATRRVKDYVDLCDTCSDRLADEEELAKEDICDMEHAPALRRLIFLLKEMRR